MARRYAPGAPRVFEVGPRETIRTTLEGHQMGPRRMNGLGGRRGGRRGGLVRRGGLLRRLVISFLVVATLAACDATGTSRATAAAPTPGLGASGGPNAPSVPGSADRAAGTGSPALPAGPSSQPSQPAAVSLPSPSPSTSPTPSASPTPGPIAMDLYRPGGFVTEASKIMCVPAAMQVMANIMTGTTDRTLTTQRRLYALARKLSPPTLKGDGAEPEGWARGLEQLGYGRFEVRALATMKAAITAAAKAVRLTGRPAGLLVWYGAHSWVMSGFTATRDPALTDRFTVTGIYVEDVWYPKISTLWGRSRPPDSLVPVSRLARDFLPWRMPGGPYPDKAWKFVVVLPLA